MSKKRLLLCFFNPFIDIIGYITNHLFRCIHIRRVTKQNIILIYRLLQTKQRFNLELIVKSIRFKGLTAQTVLLIDSLAKTVGMSPIIRTTKGIQEHR